MMKQIGTRRSVQFSSLFHTRAHNNMCCAAFAITCSTGIPTADIVFSVKSPADVTVNGWVVVSDDPLTHFLEAGNLGSLRVPSTDSNVICVTGVVDGGQGWDRSSRGPAAEYGAGRPTEAPRLAHRVELGKLGESGTSFASARACADAAHYILNNPGPVAAHTPTDLALALLGLSIGASHNSRTGFGALLS